MNEQSAAFLETDFRWVASLQSVWRDSPSHVDALQKTVADRIMGGFMPLFAEGAESVLGQPVNGPAGSGKTHLIGTLRRRVWAAGGFFVFIDLTGITEFWRTAAFGFIRSLRQPMPDGRSQYQAVFEKALLQIPKEKRVAAIQNGGGDLGSGAIRTVNIFARILQSAYPDAMEHSNVVRALLLQGDPEAAETAYSWLQGLEVEAAERTALGLTGPSPTPDSLVRGISWLMSLSGPTMIAVDQLDPIVTAGNIIADRSAGLDDETEAHARAIFHKLANGLMDLFDTTRRSMTVATCLNETWSLLRERTLSASLHRFNQTPLTLNSMTSGTDAIADLVAARLVPAFTRHGVVPDVPTWPFLPSALEELRGHWPRTILMKCEDYRLRHLDADEVPPCVSFDDRETVAPPPLPPLDAAFEAHLAEARLDDLAAGLDDGALLGTCLRDALQLYLRQLALPDSIDAVIGAAQTEARPPLHARLTFIFHDQKELEKHYCFRVLRHPTAQAVLPRLRAAMTDSGIDRKLPFRHLFVIRDTPMPVGPVTKRETDRLITCGGTILAIAEADLRVFVALRDMAAAGYEGLDAWLRAKQPLCETGFFKAVGLCPPPGVVDEAVPDTGVAEAGVVDHGATDRGATETASEERRTPPPPSAPPTQTPAAIPLGPRVQGNSLGPVQSLPLVNLVRHTAIFAGSGSGKTVLLRRIVEEAALAGIPAIVLDTNNDLARLGVPWPARPEAFTDEDAAKASRYAKDVEVVVWTPGVAGGRPLTLAVLPDFAALAAADELAQAVDMAWATLAPLACGGGASRPLKEGVLKEALTAFAREKRTGIEAFIDYLADLPVEVSRQSKAQRFGLEMSDQLRAKIAVNPLLNAAGQPLDPTVLFTAARPGATRISVVNFAGLAADASKQDFVNQLQMALFTWIKRHPSATPRLYVCDEAQNFAPSQSSTASKASAVALAQQGRKFGLGMIFATQAPKGIDTNIVSNCVTHFYGRMSSPALIEATEDMIRSRGGAARDLGALTFGLFYFSTEGTAAPVKLKAPLCLSWHPANPAAPDEVEALARGG